MFMKYKNMIPMLASVLLFPTAASAQTAVTEKVEAEMAEAESVRMARAGREMLEDNPYIDVRRAMFGKIAGLNVYAGNGDSTIDNCTLSIHGKTPLVLVDGFPRNLSLLTSYEIESVEILTDAAAAALYGVRGANGIVLVTTRRAKEGRLKVGANYQYGLRVQWRSPEFADAGLYAETLNATLRNDGLTQRYNAREIEAFKSGKYPYAYPNVDWWNEVYNNIAHNNRLNFTFEGGSGKFRHFTVVDYMYDRGFFKSQSSDSRYSAVPSDTRLSARTNIDVQLTRTTKMKLGLLARFNEQNRANYGSIFSALYNTPAAAFPITASNGMYGGSELYGANNPVALLNGTGNTKTIGGAVNADLSIIQHLDELTEGLRAEAAISFDDYGTMAESATKTYMYRVLNSTIADDGTLVTSQKDYGTNSKVISHGSWFNSIYLDFDFNAKAVYDRTFNSHHVGATAIIDIQSHTASGQNNSNRRISAGMTGSYSYDRRYSADLVLNWAGSAYLVQGHRMMFYPAVNLAWTVSRESFLKGVEGIDLLRISASTGLSGWDGSLVHELQYQTFNSIGAGSYYFTDGGLSYGITEGSLPVERIVPEKSMKASGAIELKALGNRLAFYGTGFYERRSDILINASSTVSGILGINAGKQCAGVNDWAGADLSLSWNEHHGDFSYGVYANASYLTSKVIKDDQDWQRYDYLYHKGNRVGQCYGLEADGFFFSESDIRSTVTHTFATVQPGDIKYVDQNDDFQITDEDIVPIGYSTIPEWYYGFGLSFGWKGFKVSAAFQGVGHLTVNMLNSTLYKPLVSNGNLSRSFLSKETPWTLENSESATVPRLTTVSNANNYRNNSVWYRDGSFLKLRDVTVSYAFPKRMLKIMTMEFYLKGSDVFSIDSLGIVDPERIGSGYPTSRAWWVGLRFNF